MAVGYYEVEKIETKSRCPPPHTRTCVPICGGEFKWWLSNVIDKVLGKPRKRQTTREVVHGGRMTSVKIDRTTHVVAVKIIKEKKKTALNLKGKN